jgi:hypothetical protein
MRQFTRREDNKVQLYFNCPEKINQIARMCKYTDYKDITIIIHTFGESGLPAEHRIKFGKGWMGKGAGIRGMDYLYGGLKGIHILITISESVDVIDCWLEGPEDRIHLQSLPETMGQIVKRLNTANVQFPPVQCCCYKKIIYHKRDVFWHRRNIETGGGREGAIYICIKCVLSI